MSTQTKPNITPGKCVMQKHPVHHAAMLSCPGWTQLAIVFGHKDDDLDAQGFANATLYCEAHNVANECGISPRQLLERLTKCAWELEKARQELVSCKHYLPPNGMELVDDRITRIELFLSTLNLPKP